MGWGDTPYTLIHFIHLKHLIHFIHYIHLYIYTLYTPTHFIHFIHSIHHTVYSLYALIHRIHYTFCTLSKSFTEGTRESSAPQKVKGEVPQDQKGKGKMVATTFAIEFQ